MKIARSFNLNTRTVFLAVGVITLAVNLLLATKIWKLWPALISIFFSFMDIYAAMYSMVNQFIS